MNQQTKITTCGLCSTGCRLTITQTAPQQYKVSGDKNDPVTHGALCKKGLHAIDLMLHPARLTQPLKRIGARGAGQWQPISWQQAITETAEQFNQSQQRYGNNSLFFSYGYSKDFINTQLLRLANHCNSVNIHGPETVCWAPTKFGREYTLGYNPSNDVNQHTECIIFWGVNKHNTRFTDMPAINQAIDAGATTICIDPQRSYHAKQADYWLALTPGSDLALALAMLKIVIDSNQYDHQFVSQYCLGFTELSEHLQAFSLTELANQCGVNLDLIKEITEHYITAKPAIIMSGNALDHNPDSLQVNRVIAMLMAISGNLEMTGGHSRPQGATLINGRWPYDENDVNHCDAKARANSVGTPAIPEYFRATSQGLTQAMLTAKPYPIKAGLIVGSNPLLSWPDSQQVKQAFEQLDFLAVSELFMTPTALMADIVFPAASFMEYQGISQGQDGSIHYQEAMTQVGEAKADIQIIAEIGHAMGVMPVYDEDLFWQQALSPSPISFQQLKQQGSLLQTHDQSATISYHSHGFPTASTKVELYSERLAKLGLDPLPIYRPNLPVTEQYPLRVTTAKPRHYMFSHGRQINALRQAHPIPLVRIHPELADEFGLNQGDLAAIETAPNKVIYQTVQFDENLTENLIVADLSWWFPEQGAQSLNGAFQANYNVLTSNNVGQHSDIGSFYINGLPCRIYNTNSINNVLFQREFKAL